MELLTLFYVINILVFLGFTAYAFIVAHKVMKENGKTLTFEFRIFRKAAMRKGVGIIIFFVVVSAVIWAIYYGS